MIAKSSHIPWDTLDVGRVLHVHVLGGRPRATSTTMPSTPRHLQSCAQLFLSAIHCCSSSLEDQRWEELKIFGFRYLNVVYFFWKKFDYYVKRWPARWYTVLEPRNVHRSCQISLGRWYVHPSIKIICKNTHISL